MTLPRRRLTVSVRGFTPIITRGRDGICVVTHLEQAGILTLIAGERPELMVDLIDRRDLVHDTVEAVGDQEPVIGSHCHRSGKVEFGGGDWTVVVAAGTRGPEPGDPLITPAADTSRTTWLLVSAIKNPPSLVTATTPGPLSSASVARPSSPPRLPTARSPRHA